MCVHRGTYEHINICHMPQGCGVLSLPPPSQISSWCGVPLTTVAFVLRAPIQLYRSRTSMTTPSHGHARHGVDGVGGDGGVGRC